MFSQLKKKVDKELASFLFYVNCRYQLHKTSPLLFSAMKHFILGKGKRIRPILFIIGYKGFSRKNPKNLYRSALAVELLHDFLLVHDDIVDNSDMRRGKASMHKLFNQKLKGRKNITFGGKELAMITGDIMYAIAIESFLCIHTKPERKIKALAKFIEATCYTGCGEFIELLYSSENVKNIHKNQILKIYDYKTAYYTFIAPLTTGAILAGAPDKEIAKLFRYGFCLGRAFQINDDILGVFGIQKKTGKPGNSDLQESKKTLLIWYAYNHADKKQKSYLKNILNKGRITQKDLALIRNIIKDTGSLAYAKLQVKNLIRESEDILQKSKIESGYRKALLNYTNRLLK